MTDPITAIKDLPDQDVAYNDIFFNQLTSFHIRAQPEYDAANRTTVSTLYTISARSIEYEEENAIEGHNDLGTILLDKRKRLLEAGKRLVIRGIGFGDTSTTGNFPDIVWGPQPREASFQPLGGGVCYQLDWVCDFRLAECAGAGALRSSVKPLMAFNYDVTYSNDEWGFTTRTISGTAMIPQPRAGRIVTSQPLDYCDRVVINVPIGYRRVRNDWNQNAAQNELSFTVVDEQLKTEAPPEGIAKAEVLVGLTAKSTGGGIFPMWLLTISGTMETLPGFPKSWAAARFFAIVDSYVTKLRGRVSAKAFVLPVTYEMRFGAFGRASQFNTAFLLQAMQDDIFVAVGSDVLYSPLPDSSYAKWRSSRFANSTIGLINLDKLWSAGGQSDLTLTRPEIVDLCKSTQEVQLLGSANLFPLSGSFPSAFPGPGPAGYYNGAGLTPQNSYVAYEPEMSLVRDDRKSVNKRDLTLDVTIPRNGDPKSYFKQPSSSYPSYTAPADKVVACGAPEQILCFSGSAVRVGYPVAIAQIPAINGVKLDWLGGDTKSVRGPSMIAKVPIHYGSWEHYYRPQSYISADSLVMPHPHLDV